MGLYNRSLYICLFVFICPTQVGYDDELQSGRDPDEDDENADELPWDSLWQFVQKIFCYVNKLLQQLSRWLVSDDLWGEDAGCGGPGLVWLDVAFYCGQPEAYLCNNHTV